MTMMTMMSTCLTPRTMNLSRNSKMLVAFQQKTVQLLNPNEALPNRFLEKPNPSYPNSKAQKSLPLLPQHIPLQSQHWVRLENHSTRANESKSLQSRIKIDIPGYQIFVIKKAIVLETKTMICEHYIFLRVHGNN